jgi:CheY-like chemotaxis protein
MRLNFNVLWVDDQPDRVAAQVEGIQRRMESEGFHFNSTPCVTLEDVQRLVTDNVFTDEVDLVLVDWELGSNLKGQDVIALIRESVRYKDVVFYSAQPAIDLRKLAAGLEGIYCASRAELVDEVMGVFESLVKKVLDLDHMRGIVMGATSDIDQMVNECLLTMHARLDQGGKEMMFNAAQEYVEKRIEGATNLAEKLRQITKLEELFEAHDILTANDRLRMLGGALKIKTFEAQSAYRKSVVKYQQKTIPKRNELGHLVLVPEGRPIGVTAAGGKTVNMDEMRELRKQILGLRTDFQNLLTALRNSSPVVAAASGTPLEKDN